MAPAPEEDARRLLGVIKSNLSPEPPTLAWHRDRDQPVSGDGIAARSVSAVMSGAHRTMTKVEAARAFLEDVLAEGSLLATEVKMAGTRAGLGKQAIDTASQELGVIKQNELRLS